MQGQRWSKPIWSALATSTLWVEGVQASKDARPLPDGYLRLYGLFDPHTLEIRYIGATKKTLETRLLGHLKHGRSKANDHRANWLRSLDQPPVIHELMQLESPLALAAEQALIFALTELGARLVNTHAGGGGFDSHGEDARARASAGIRAAWTRGAYETETRKRASKKSWETRRARLASGELQPQVAWNRGKTHSVETRKNISSARLRGRRPQSELVQLVADHAGLSYNQVYRSLKGSNQKPPEHVIIRAWQSYDALKDQLQDLRVKLELRPS